MQALLGFLGAMLGGALAAWLAAMLNARHWRYSSRAAAAAEVARQYSYVQYDLSNAHREQRRLDDAALIDWRPWNAALHAARLSGSQSVIDAIDDLDRAVWSLRDRVGNGLVEQSLGGWQSAKAATGIDDRFRDFINASRRDLKLGGVVRQVNRPADLPEPNPLGSARPR